MTATIAPPLDRVGRYEILAELGRGAMGVVYKARDPLIDRLVALKTIGVEDAGQETDTFRERFFREARSAGALSHPNIVTIHDVGEEDHVAYIAMEFLPGRSLRAILDSGTVLPPELVADLAAQVADGLAFAHDRQIVHRDIKPANIMVLDNGVAKITDFGIARMPTGTRTVAGTVFGSPKYMSPERVRGVDVDGRTDVFSLGAVLYEMLTGLPPFPGNDLSTLLDQILHVMPVPPCLHNRALPPAFDAIVAKALAKEPDERYASARDMAADLRRACNVDAVIASPAPESATAQRTSGAPPAAKPVLPAVLPPGVATARDILAAIEPKGGATTATAQSAGDRSRSGLIFVGSVLLLAVVLLAVGVGLLGRRTPPPPSPIPTALPTATPPTQAVTAQASPPAAPRTAEAPATIPRVAPAPEAPKEPPKVTGSVGMAIAPWGEIYVNGRKVGVTPPLKVLKLVPGKYAVEIRNGTFPPFRANVDVQPNAAVTLSHRFE